MQSASAAKCRVGVDVGGTFTDLVLVDPKSGSLTFYKEPSRPAEPADAVVRGLAGIMDRAGVAPGEIGLLVHGTTLGLNTIIQRQGAKLALVVSPGNRDVFEIGRSRMPSSYDLSVPKEVPLVPRDLVFEVGARMLADGTVESRPSPEEVVELAAELRRHEVDAVAIMFLNAYVDGALEDEVGHALEAALPGVLITRSATLWPEIREYERALVAALNAYIHPLMGRYLGRLRERLDAMGVAAPLYITASNGGTLSLESARNRPIDTVLSGPATGVVAAARLSGTAGPEKIVTVDMGGTSCDMAVSQGGEPEYTTRTTVGDFPLILPVVDITAIGAGGGSIIWVDSQGLLKVGPESAGAEPGPACYGRGGERATITDCYLVTGHLHSEAFLGGRMALDREAAARVLDAIASQIGLDGEDRAARAAESALRVATAKMATELYKAFAQRGLDPREYTLIAYGGAGPTQANMLAEEIRSPTIKIAPSPGTLCALGAVMTDIRRDYLRMVRSELDDDGATVAVMRAALDAMEAEATAWVSAEGDLVGETTLSRSGDMRYAGQAYELSVDLPEDSARALDAGGLGELFHRVHEQVYGFRDEDARIEVTALRTRVVGKVPPIGLPTLEAASGAARAIGRRDVFHDGAWLAAEVYRRADLAAGHALAGPALVEQEDTTIWILPGWRGTVDGHGNLEIERE